MRMDGWCNGVEYKEMPTTDDWNIDTEYYYDGTKWVVRAKQTTCGDGSTVSTEVAKLPKNTVIVTEVDGVSKAFSYYLGKDGYYAGKSQDGLGYMEAGGTYPAGYNPEVCRQTTTTTAHTSVQPSFYNPFVIRNNYGEICQYKTDNILIAIAGLVIVTCHIIGLVAFLRKGKK